MSTHFKAGLVAAATLAALVSPAVATAAFVPSGTVAVVTSVATADVTATTTSPGSPSSAMTVVAGRPSEDFLSQTLEQLRAARAEPLAASLGDSAAITFRQSAPALQNPLSSSLRGSSDLFLWNFVALIHAQQLDRTFDLVDTGLTAWQPLQTNVVSQVPLPASIWLFLIGVLGLAGARLTSSGRADDPAQEDRGGRPAFGTTAAA